MRFLLAILTICCLSYAHAQSDWAAMMEDEQVDFYQVQDAFNDYWETHTVEKGKGFKQFKRWEYFMEPRVYPSGQRFGADAVHKELKDYVKQNPQAKSLQGDWTYIGNNSVPNNGGGAGRINAVRVHPTNSNILFACAPAGGLWKSTDQGNSWAPLTEELEYIGTTDVLIDPSNTQVIYLATGDGDAGDTYSLGVLKSTNGGSTWSSTGLNWSYTQARRISRLAMHPINNNVLWAATSNGVFKTTDAGATWTQTQEGNFKDLEIHPSNPDIIYVAGSSIYRSTNGGDSFNLVTSGLPASDVSRYALGVSPAQANYVYALAGGSGGFIGLFRSTNSGASFSQRSSSPNILGWSSNGSDSGSQAWYDLAIAVDATNANIIYTGGVNIWKSSNGGQSWSLNGHWTGSGAPYVHADIHSLDILNGNLYVGCDGGVFSTTNGGSSYSDKSDGLEIAQMYRLGTSQTQANLVISGWQDNGTNLKNGNIWTRPIGGDGMECIIDYTNASIMYGELYYGSIGKSTNGGATFSNIVSSSGNGVHSSGSWVTPYVLDPTNHNTIYVGKANIYRSINGGNSWSTLSTPTNENTDALVIAPSDSDYIYYSANNALYGSSNGGASFQHLNAGLPDLYVSYITVSDTDPEKVWVCFSGFLDNEKIYASTDGGSTWTNISNGLPNVPCNTIVYQNGSNDGLYIGTDIGVFYRNGVYSSWQPFFSGMPNIIVSELEVNYLTNTLVAATFGRGLWQSDLFSTYDLDAGIGEIVSPQGSICMSEVIPEVRIQNFGNTVLTSATIQHRTNGGNWSTFAWTGSLSVGESELLSLPAQNLSGGQHSFEAFTEDPNGGTDDFSPNDLKTIEFSIASEELVFQLIADAYGGETTWEIIDENGEMVVSGGPYTTAQTIGEYPQPEVDICIPSGCFDFKIYDSYGDGICCGYGSGSWALLDAEGQVLISDASAWDDEFTASFCIEADEACTGDLNNDGWVGILDFIMFNSAYGQNCSGCEEDINDDGTVGIEDFLIFNSMYGTICGSGVQLGVSSE